MYCIIFFLTLLGSTSQEEKKTNAGELPLCLKLKDRGLVIVESNRLVVFMIDNDGAIKWVARDLETRNNIRISEVFDVDKARKFGLAERHLVADHIFVSAPPRVGKGHSELIRLSLKDGKCTFMGSD